MTTPDRPQRGPRTTTEDERLEMARVARQHYRVMKELQLERLRAERTRSRSRTRSRYCRVCGDKTENGCPICSAFLCNPYVTDCYEQHARQKHRVLEVVTG